jgi:hypothetical protein
MEIEEVTECMTNVTYPWCPCPCSPKAPWCPHLVIVSTVSNHSLAHIRYLKNWSKMHVVKWWNVWERVMASLIAIMFQIIEMVQYYTTHAFNNLMPKSMTTCAWPDSFLAKQWSQPSLIYTSKKLLELFNFVAIHFEL